MFHSLTNSGIYVDSKSNVCIIKQTLEKCGYIKVTNAVRVVEQKRVTSEVFPSFI
jgi:hypothetical protein